MHKELTCNVGLKLKRYTDKIMVSSIAIEVEYTWKKHIKDGHWQLLNKNLPIQSQEKTTLEHLMGGLSKPSRSTEV